MLNPIEKVKLLVRKKIDIGKGSSSFSSLTYCIIDKKTCTPTPGHYRLQITDCNNVFFLSSSKINYMIKTVKKIVDCLEKAIVISKNNKPRTRRWKLSESQDITYEVSKVEIFFNIVSRKKPLNLGEGNGFYNYPKEVFLCLHGRNIMDTEPDMVNLSASNRKHFILRLTRLRNGLNGFLTELNAVK